MSAGRFCRRFLAARGRPYACFDRFEDLWLALLILMAAVALLGLRMTRTVDDQLAIIDQNYFPAYVCHARSGKHSLG